MLYVLLIIAGLLSWFAMRIRTIVFGICAFGAWFVTMGYVATYPPGSLTQGDTLHGMLVIVLAGAGISVLIMSIRAARSKEYNIDMDYGDVENHRVSGRVTSETKSISSTRHGWNSGEFNENYDEHKVRMYKLLHPKRSRR